MTNQDEGAFRMRVRVKAGSHNVAVTAAPDAGSSSAAGGAKPKSLIEALKQTSVPATPRSRKTATPKAAAKRSAKKKQVAKKASEPRITSPDEATETKSESPALAPARDEFPAATKETPRDVISTKSGSSGNVAARLRHLERLREATASLEFVTSGKIEEATVEIIHHEKPRTAESATKG